MEPRRRFHRRNEDEEAEEKIRVAKSVTEKQRLRLEKLLKNIDKPVVIPEAKKEHKPAPPPEFVRNVVAGSGEYHIYRNLRKKEYARNQFYEEEKKKELLDKEFQTKVEEHKRAAEERTLKRRAKRLKKKQNQRNAAKKAKKDSTISGEKKSDDEEESSDDEEATEEHETDVKNNSQASFPEH